MTKNLKTHSPYLLLIYLPSNYYMYKNCLQSSIIPDRRSLFLLVYLISHLFFFLYFSSRNANHSAWVFFVFPLLFREKQFNSLCVCQQRKNNEKLECRASRPTTQSQARTNHTLSSRRNINWLGKSDPGHLAISIQVRSKIVKRKIFTFQIKSFFVTDLQFSLKFSKCH